MSIITNKMTRNCLANQKLDEKGASKVLEIDVVQRASLHQTSNDHNRAWGGNNIL